MHSSFEPLVQAVVLIELKNPESELATKSRALFTQLPKDQQFTLMSFCLTADVLKEGLVLIEHGLDWLLQYLNENNPLPECYPGNDNLELFAHNAALVVQTQTDEVLDRAFQMVAAFGKRIGDAHVACPPSTIKLLLTTSIVPHGKFVGTEAIHKCTLGQGMALLAALQKCCDCEDILYVIKAHEAVICSPLLDTEVQTMAFTNLLQKLAVRHTTTAQHGIISEVLLTVESQLPRVDSTAEHSCHATWFAAFRTDDVEVIEGAVLHMLVMIQHQGPEFITPEIFGLICQTGSVVGCMAFLWEVTCILSRASKWKQGDSEWTQLFACACSWQLAIEGSILDGSLDEFGAPALTMVFELLSQFFRVNPTEERPAFVDFAVSKGNTEYSKEEHQLFESQWQAFHQLYDSLEATCNLVRNNAKRGNRILTIHELCVWTASALQEAHADDSMPAAIESISEAEPTHYSRQIQRINLVFDKSILKTIDDLSPLLHEKELSKLILTVWRCLESEDMEILTRAGSLFVLQAHSNPTRIRELLCRELYSQCYITRKQGVKRFWNLWMQRKKLGTIFEVIAAGLSPGIRQQAEAMVYTLHTMYSEEVQSTIDMLPPIFGIAAAPVVDLCQDSCFEVASRARQMLSTALKQDTVLFLSVSIHQMGKCAQATGISPAS